MFLGCNSYYRFSFNVIINNPILLSHLYIYSVALHMNITEVYTGVDILPSSKYNIADIQILCASQKMLGLHNILKLRKRVVFPSSSKTDILIHTSTSFSFLV